MIFFAANPFEKKCRKQLGAIENKNKNIALEILRGLFLENSIGLLMYIEWQYKGYKISKKKRSDCYQELFSIAENFKICFRKSAIVLENISDSDVLINLINFVNDFVRNLNIKYRSEASIYGLFLDRKNKEADCNQFVALYIHLFLLLGLSLDDLKIILEENHVLISVKDKFIECTSQSLTHRNCDSNCISLDAIEIIGVNILDVKDSNQKLFSLENSQLLKVSVIANYFGVANKISNQNLKNAYRKFLIENIRKRNWEKCLSMFSHIQDKSLIEDLVNYTFTDLLNKKLFYKAEKVIVFSRNRQELKILLNRARAYDFYSQKKYEQALNIAENTDLKIVKACYEGIVVRELNKLQNIKNTKKLIKALRSLLPVARKAENSKLQNIIEGNLKRLG